MTRFRLFVLACGFSVLALAASRPATAETWPSRTVTIIVPFANGTGDLVARSLADYLRVALHQAVIVENRGGAGGNIGATAVARANPDGYTLLMGTTGPAANNKLLYKNMPYDPQRDFAPIALLGKAPLIITARNDFPAKTLPELIDYAKAHPGKVTVGYPGNGTFGHITGELLQQRANVKFVQVQYRGSSNIITDLLGGTIDIAIDSMAPYVPMVQADKMRALAVAGPTRWPLLPNVATVSESGFPGFEASVWYAFLAPANTPPAVIAILNKASNDYLKTDMAKQVYQNLGIQPIGSTPEELKAFVDAELEKWAPIINGANIKF